MDVQIARGSGVATITLSGLRRRAERRKALGLDP
jgi:hypothetical protein